jgi:serine phosphatase RsbU (regulator of sigma subunit)
VSSPSKFDLTSIDASDIDALHEISGPITAVDRLPTVLSQVVSVVSSLVPCDSCFVYVFDGTDLVLRASKNPHPDIVGRLKLRVGQGLTGWVAKHCQPVAVARHAFEDPRFRVFNELPEDRYEAFLSVPVLSRGKLVGVINLQHGQPYEHSRREIQLMSTIGLLVGAEIEMAQMEGAFNGLSGELRNFEEIARGIVPRPESVPSLACMDIAGQILPLNGVTGGDHLIYVDFKKRYDLDTRIKNATEAGRPDVADNLERCRRKAGIALIDVAGHHSTDAMLAAMFHQAFHTGALYEMDLSGHITRRLFEDLNQRFNRTSSVNKFITMLYGEISEVATFRFLSTGHPPPMIFSVMNDRFMEVRPEAYTSFPPLGMFPSQNVVDKRHARHNVLGFKDRYEVNEWTLMGSGDILLLHSDGLLEHSRGNEPYFPDQLEQTIRGVKQLSASEIVHTIVEDLRAFADPIDDVSLVVVKRC